MKAAKAREEAEFENDAVTWSTHPRYQENVAAFRRYEGDPIEHFGEFFEIFFCPWDTLIDYLKEQRDAELVAEFTQHQQADAKEFATPSWSFGEMVVRQHLKDMVAQ